MKISMIVLLSLILAGAAFGIDEQVDAPTSEPTRPVLKDPESQQIARAYDIAEAKAKAEYERAVTIARKEATAKFQARMNVLTQNNRLDAAVAVRDFIAFLNPKSEASQAKGGTLFMPVERVVGTWTETNGATYVFANNGRFVFAGGQPGFWQLTSDKLILTWNTKAGQPNFNRVDTYDTLDGDWLRGESSTIGHRVQISRAVKAVKR